MTEALYGHLRTCKYEKCENKFEVPKEHPTKVYCSALCRRRAEHSRRRGLVATGEIEVDLDTIDDLKDLLAERGMDIDDWVVIRVTVNKWEGFYKDDTSAAVKVPLRQLKVFLRPKTTVFELRAANPLPPAPSALRPRAKKESGAREIFIYGDDQRPNVDTTFEKLKLELLKDYTFDEIIDLGDGMDTPTISTHKINPAMNWSINECADNYATWLYAVSLIAPGTRKRILADNHTTGRLRDYVLAKAKDLYGARPADIPGLEKDLEPLMSINRLLRLEELGWEYVAPPGDTHYAESQIEIIPGELVAIHGYRTGLNLGKKYVDDFGCSVIYGHDHGQDVYATDTRRRGTGTRKRIFALGVGCGANLHGGGGFAPGADWQNCALTVTVFPDNSWTFDYVNYANGTLTWRNRQYKL